MNAMTNDPVTLEDPAGERPPLLRWPLPALLAWAAAWIVQQSLQTLVGDATALVVATLLGAAIGWRCPQPWRRAIVAAGFPLAMAISDGATVPAWLWLVPLGVLALTYPSRTWGDAPLFPTPAGALDELPALVSLPPQARVLDAGCGLGHGLRALHRAYPQARIEGIEWSWPLRWWTGLRCRFAHVRRGDLWQDPWTGLDLVYLFQRPETMLRLMAKADAEMTAGRWLVSLAFEVPGRTPHAVFHTVEGRPVWVYRVGSAQVPTHTTDMNLQEPDSGL